MKFKGLNAESANESAECELYAMKNKLTDQSDWNNIYKKCNLPILPNTCSWLGIQIFPILEKVFQGIKDLRFLEAGCAPGRYGIFFRKYFGYDISGFDYSLDGVNLTKSNWNYLGIRGEVILADVFNLPKKLDNSFDIVLSAGLIEHFSNPKDIIDIFSNLISDDGYIVTIIPNTNKCLNMQMLKYFNKNEWLEIKRTHKPIGMKEFKSYHSQFVIISTKCIIGFFHENLIPYSNIFARLIKRFINFMLLFLVKFFPSIDNTFFISHLFLIGKKNKLICNSIKHNTNAITDS